MRHKFHHWPEPPKLTEIQNFWVDPLTANYHLAKNDDCTIIQTLPNNFDGLWDSKLIFEFLGGMMLHDKTKAKRIWHKNFNLKLIV